MSVDEAVREAHPRRVRVGDALFVLSLALDARVEAVAREQGVRRLTLADGKGELIGELEPVRWRYLAPEATEPVDLPDGDVLRAVDASSPPRAAGAPPVDPELARRLAFFLRTFGVLMAIALGAWVLVYGMVCLCFGAALSYALNEPKVVQQDALQPGTPATVQVEVKAGKVLSVWLRHEVEAPTDEWAVEGTVSIDGLDFPVDLGPERPAMPGLSETERDSREVGPGYERYSALGLLGAIPPEDADRTVTIEADLHVTGGRARQLELVVRD